MSSAEEIAKADARKSASGSVTRVCANCGLDLVVFAGAPFTRHSVNDSDRCPTAAYSKAEIAAPSGSV